MILQWEAETIKSSFSFPFTARWEDEVEQNKYFIILQRKTATWQREGSVTPKVCRCCRTAETVSKGQTAWRCTETTCFNKSFVLTRWLRFNLHQSYFYRPPPHQRPAQGGDAENQRRNAWNGTATSRFSDVCDRPTRRLNVTPLLRSTNNAIRLKY